MDGWRTTRDKIWEGGERRVTNVREGVVMMREEKRKED
jgi:hypothetical protein